MTMLMVATTMMTMEAGDNGGDEDDDGDGIPDTEENDFDVI